jgi:excinuclease ABC subunit A
MDVVAAADWVIDLGPAGGDAGGRIMAAGTPDVVARSEESRTAPYLAATLQNAPENTLQ